MARKTKVFVDRLVGITLRGGVARLDFCEIDETHDPEKKAAPASPKAKVVHRLYLPMEGFELASAAFQQTLERFREEARKASIGDILLPEDKVNPLSD